MLAKPVFDGGNEMRRGRGCGRELGESKGRQLDRGKEGGGGEKGAALHVVLRWCWALGTRPMYLRDSARAMVFLEESAGPEGGEGARDEALMAFPDLGENIDGWEEVLAAGAVAGFVVAEEANLA